MVFTMIPSRRHVYKTISIPARLLENIYLRYILISKPYKDPTRKKPKEKRFLTDNNYRYDAPVLLGWLFGGSNYGILTGVANLVVFDADQVNRLRELGILDKLPPTFTVRTGGGGLHFYFYVKGLIEKIILWDKTLLNDKGTPLHLGEILGKGFFVIGPGSTHRSGNKYEVINDVPIAEIKKEDLLALLNVVKTNKTEKVEKQEYHKVSTLEEVSIDTIAYPLHAKRRLGSNGAEIYGEHPLHGATEVKDRGKSTNFHINLRDNVWRCFACHSGGGWVQWLAVKEGIIRCDQAGKGCLTKEQFKQVIKIAKDQGLIRDDSKWTDNDYREALEKGLCKNSPLKKVRDSDESNVVDTGIEENTQKKTLQNKESGTPPCLNTGDESDKLEENECHKIDAKEESLNQVDQSEINHILIDSIPDQGPRTGVTHLKASPRSRKTHNAIKWMALSGSGNYFTHNHAVVAHALRIFTKLHGVSAVWLEGMRQPGMCRFPGGNCDSCKLKPDNTKEGNTKYLELEAFSKKLLKEKNILTKNDVPKGMCPYFVLKLAEPYARFCFTVIHNIDRVRPRRFTVLDEDPTIRHFYPQSVCIAKIKQSKGEAHVVNYIDSKIGEEILEFLKPESRKHGKAIVEKISELSGLIDANYESGAEAVAAAIRGTLENWDAPKIHIRTEGLEDDEELTMEGAIRCITNLYKDEPVSLVKTGGGYQAIYLIADESEPVFDLEHVPTETPVVLIGGTNAELFCKHLQGEIWEVPTFIYADRFVVLAVDGDDKESKKKNRGEQKRKVKEIIGKVNGSREQDMNMPVLALTGSKANQEQLARSLGESYCSMKGRETAQNKAYAFGLVNIFYQNSIMSRGIDVERYNLIAAYDTNFAQPFWNIYNKETAAKIVRDETTNSVLRISPTLKNDLETVKLIVIPKNDVWKVQYLEDRTIETDASSDKITRIIRKLLIPGTVNFVDGDMKNLIRGMPYKGALDRIREELEEIESDLDETLLETTKAMILDHLKKHRKSNFTMDELKEVLGLPHNYIRNALEDLSYQNLVDYSHHVTKASKGGLRWKFLAQNKTSSTKDGNSKLNI